MEWGSLGWVHQMGQIQSPLKKKPQQKNVRMGLIRYNIDGTNSYSSITSNMFQETLGILEIS